MKADIEKQAAELLLKRGVIVPVTAPLLFRLFRKELLTGGEITNSSHLSESSS